jgi:hypothetical protein
MSEPEYLVAFGSAGDFSRFRAVPPEAYERGDRVVVRTYRGLELGEVMCPATAAHAGYLSERARGELLRRVTAEDEQAAAQRRASAERLFADACRLADDLRLPVEFLDVEILLEGGQATLHHLCRDASDLRPLVGNLSRRYDLLIVLHNLALASEPEEEPAGCGRPDCGRGGCGSCAAGGCGVGGCGSGARKPDVAAYLAALGRRADGGARTSLL